MLDHPLGQWKGQSSTFGHRTTTQPEWQGPCSHVPMRSNGRLSGPLFPAREVTFGSTATVSCHGSGPLWLPQSNQTAFPRIPATGTLHPPWQGPWKREQMLLPGHATPWVRLAPLGGAPSRPGICVYNGRAYSGLDSSRRPEHTLPTYLGSLHNPRPVPPCAI